MPEPIEITLYGPDDEPLKTYRCAIVRWGLLKKASRLSQQMDVDASGPDAAEASLSEVSQFVVSVFNDQFTVEELEAGADFGEVMTVLQAIISRAKGLVQANPTLPPQKSK
jgi:hypothetical protein